MKKVDSTKYTKKYMSMPNFSLLFIVILLGSICLVLGQAYQPPIWCFYPGHYELTAANSDHYQPLSNNSVTVYIDREGKIWVNSCYVKDYRNLQVLIEDCVVSQKSNQKILLDVSGNVPFKKVQMVLKAAKEAKIDTVGLITTRNAAILDLI